MGECRKRVPERGLLDRTNVNGGAIVIGHPLGASGARTMTTLVNALHQRGGRYGLQTMCDCGGMANATIIERLGLLPAITGCAEDGLMAGASLHHAQPALFADRTTSSAGP